MRIAIVILFMALSAGVANAQTSASVEVSFSGAEVEIIRGYFSTHTLPQASGKGRKNGKGLPPGIARNLARGKALPPGIAKQFLPTGLTGLLPPVRDGYERVIIDGKVLLVEIATQVIRDVLYDVVRRS